MDSLALLYFKICYSIIKANSLFLGIVGITYIIEKFTGLSLFVDQFKWKKSQNNAEALLVRDSVNYFFLLAGVFIFDLYKENIELNPLSIGIWLVIVVILIRLFRKYHSKYQAVDPGKTDDDYS
ncbi:MAG: hypothetical protein AB7W47_15435 [Calditrichaceae bacterium]